MKLMKTHLQSKTGYSRSLSSGCQKTNTDWDNRGWSH